MYSVWLSSKLPILSSTTTFLTFLSLHIFRSVPFLPHCFFTKFIAYRYFCIPLFPVFSFSFSSFHLPSFPLFSLLSSPLNFNFCFLFLSLYSYIPSFLSIDRLSHNTNEYQKRLQRGEGGRCLGLTTLPPSCADCLEICDPQPSGTFGVCPGLYRDCFTLFYPPFLSVTAFVHLTISPRQHVNHHFHKTGKSEYFLN
jgi:hypothetical protein